MNKYLFMDASTQSEWDDVDFCLVLIDEVLIKQFTELPALLEDLKAKHGIDNFSIYTDVMEFYTDREQLPERLAELNDGSIIELSDEEVAALSQPEQTIKYGHICFGGLAATFSASGKHTGEEYWCSTAYETVVRKGVAV